jgi:large subunit ribosomal protein L29
MKYQDIQLLPTKELVERYKEEKLRMTHLKISHAITPLDQPHHIKQSRRLIAKYLMELNNRRKDFQLTALQNKA